MTKNLKNCDGKAPLDLLPAGPLRAIASAFHDGAAIYEPWDWAEKTDGCREMYVAAALRHLLAYADLEDSDYTADSGVHHLAAAGANIMILLHHDGIDYHVPSSVAEPDKPIPYKVAEPERVLETQCVAHASRGERCTLGANHSLPHRSRTSAGLRIVFWDSYHVPNSVAEPDEPIPYYVPADAKQVPPTAEPLLEELRSLPTNEPRCSKRWDHHRCQLGTGHGGTHVYDPDREPSVLAGDVRAQCPAYDQNGTRCLKDDEHEGLHENDSAIWNDGACRQGCP